MEYIKGPTKETPALCQNLKIFKSNINCQEVQEDIISLFCPTYNFEKFNKCSIFHLKSINSEDTKDKRIKRLLKYGINFDLTEKSNLNFISELHLDFLVFLKSYVISLIIFLRLFFKN